MYNLLVRYRYWDQDEDIFFIEFTKDTFKTKIKFDFTPDESFLGLAIGCNYHYNGNPIGYIKDNGLVMQQIKGKDTGIFIIENTVVQAGPILVENSKARIDYRAQGFSASQIISGLQIHIGEKKSGNILVGMTKQSTYRQIVDKYLDHNVDYALKLPGLKQGSFYYKSQHKEISEGLFPIPCALIIY
jgi:hypothetical protein